MIHKVIFKSNSRLTTAALVFVALLAVVAPRNSFAQEKNTEFYLGATFVRLNPDFTRPDFRFNRDTDQVGGNVSITGYFKGSPIGLTADVAATFRSANRDDSSLLTIMGGPTIKARGHRVEPSAHAFVGIARLAAANQQTSFRFDKSNSGLAYAFGGALDVRVNRRLAIRLIQGDYLATRILGMNDRHLRLGAGIAFRF